MVDAVRRTEQLWWSIVHPRIRAFLPAGRILEIAPGHGRATQYLLGSCARLTAVDLNASCVHACEQRFAGVEHLDLDVNDGRSLPMIGDASIDFAFSFDSLVQVDRDVVQSYLHQLARTLALAGVAFLHHSNAAAFTRAGAAADPLLLDADAPGLAVGLAAGRDEQPAVHGGGQASQGAQPALPLGLTGGHADLRPRARRPGAAVLRALRRARARRPSDVDLVEHRDENADQHAVLRGRPHRVTIRRGAGRHASARLPRRGTMPAASSPSPSRMAVTPA